MARNANDNMMTRPQMVFLVLQSAYSQDPAPIFTINTSNDVVSRKDVPFGGLENKILHFDPIFPQNANFCQFSTGRQIGVGELKYGVTADPLLTDREGVK